VTTSEILQRDRARKARQREERQGRRILRLRQVQTKTGKSRSSVYEDVEAGTFPKPIPLGKRAVGWLEDEVDDWIDACAAKRDAGEAV
jgi:prophage regulatory protein